MEAVCSSLKARLQAEAGEAKQDVQEEIAIMKQGIASLAHRCEEILDLAKELARELDSERKGRHAEVEKVLMETRQIHEDLEQSVVQKLQQQSQHSCRWESEMASVREAVEGVQQIREDLEQSLVQKLQQQNQHSCRWESELASVRVAVEGAMREMSAVKDQSKAEALQLSVRQMQHEVRLEDAEMPCGQSVAPAGGVNNIDSLVVELERRANVGSQLETQRRHAQVQQPQRSWDEEAANIRAHLKRFQDTFSKSLSLERESRQRDVNMLLTTIDQLPEATAAKVKMLREQSITATTENVVPGGN